MPKETFALKRFNKKSHQLLGPIEEIAEGLAAQGLTASVRQLFYRLVARNLIPNSLKSYKNIVGLLTNARLAGRLDWDLFEDRHRKTSVWASWANLGEFLNDIKHDFAIDKWLDQDNYVELMVEKDSLAGVIRPVCARLGIPFTANKGYSSVSMFYQTGKRFRANQEAGKNLHMVYLGDHDPSGIDMTRDVETRVPLLGGDWMELGGIEPLDIKVHRVALNMPQVKKYNPPENPCKEEDSRAPKYVAEFGEKSWELDALDPPVLADIIEKKVKSLRDEKKWEAAVAREKEVQETLKKLVEKYTKKKRTKK